MKQKEYIITGVNRLTGRREELSRPMGEQEARERLDREKAARYRQRYQTHKNLRVERRHAIQLTLNFAEYD